MLYFPVIGELARGNWDWDAWAVALFLFFLNKCVNHDLNGVFKKFGFTDVEVLNLTMILDRYLRC